MALSPEKAREYGKLGGRPVGSSSKPRKPKTTFSLGRRRATLATKRFLPGGPNDPRIVLEENMIFWRDDAERIAAALGPLLDSLKAPGEGKDPTKGEVVGLATAAQEAAALVRRLLRARKEATAIAVELMPYCYPKFHSVAFEKDPAGDEKVQALIEQALRRASGDFAVPLVVDATGVRVEGEKVQGEKVPAPVALVVEEVAATLPAVSEVAPAPALASGLEPGQEKTPPAEPAGSEGAGEG